MDGNYTTTVGETMTFSISGSFSTIDGYICHNVIYL